MPQRSRTASILLVTRRLLEMTQYLEGQAMIDKVNMISIIDRRNASDDAMTKLYTATHAIGPYSSSYHRIDKKTNITCLNICASTMLTKASLVSVNCESSCQKSHLFLTPRYNSLYRSSHECDQNTIIAGTCPRLHQVLDVELTTTFTFSCPTMA